MADLPISGPSAGSRRFWITVATFALLNVAAWFGYHAWLKGQALRKDILAVQSFEPGEGEVLPGDLQATLSWTFNLDVGKPGPVAAGPKGELPATLQPAINGEWLWTDARTLTFEAHEKLPRATRFVATLNPAMLRSTDGYTLAKPVVNSFTTVPLQLKSVKQAAFDGQDRILLELEFNDKVIPGEVMRYLNIEGPDGKPVAATLNGQGAGTIVRVLTDPIPFVEQPVEGRPLLLTSGSHSANAPASTTPARAANSLLVKILPGLTGASGPLGITEVDAREVAIAHVLLADKLEAHEGSEDFYLRFNNDVTQEMLDKIKPLLSVEPVVTFTAERRSDYPGIVTLRGAFEPATRYTLTIGKVAQANDTRKYPRPASLSAFMPDRGPSAVFEHTTGYLGSKGNRTLLVKTVNAPAIWVSAERVYENNLTTWRNSGGYDGDRNTQEYGHPMAMRRYVLANKKNVSQDFRIDLDDLLGKDAASDGVYSIDIDMDMSGAGTPPDEDTRRNRNRSYSSSSALVTLSDIGLTAKLMASPANPATEKAILAWAVSLSSGQPLADVKVRIYSDKNQLLGEGVTDGMGLAQIDHLNPAEGETPRVLIAESAKAGEGKAKSLTWLDLPRTQRNESDFATAGRPYLRQGYEAFVWAERGVYRPGETVTLRTIVRGTGMSTPPEKLPVRWQIRRPDGRDWQSQMATLDADGAAEWRVTFPADAQTGYWSAHIGLPGQTGTGSSGMETFGDTGFQIEEFMPDRMKIALALSGPGLDKKSDAPGRLRLADGPLLADVQSDYLFGQPAANLQSQLTVRFTPSAFSVKTFPASEGWVTGDRVNAAEVFAGAKPSSDGLDPMNQTLDKNGHTQFEVDLRKKLAAALPGKANAQTQPAVVDLYQFRGPWRVAVSANTVETGGRAVTAYADAEADALPRYLMVRPTGEAARGYSGAGVAIHYDVALITPGGDKATDENPAIRVTVYRESWINTLVMRGGRYQYQSTRTLEAIKGQPAPVELLHGAGALAWTPESTGSYVLEFADTETRQVTTLRFIAGKEGGWNDNVSQANPEHLEVQLLAADADGSASPTDKKSPIFKVGQEVKAVVRSPFAGRLLLTVETDTVLISKVVDMKGSVTEVAFTLPEGARPNGYVGATVIRAIDPNKEWSTHRAYGLARFGVDSSDRRLNVKINNPREIRPTRSLEIALTITDSSGKPVQNAAVALAAVDEGILRVTEYQTPNPLSFYNGLRSLGIDTSDLYSSLMPEVSKLDGESKVGGGGEGGDDSGFNHRHSSPVTTKRVRPVSLVSDIVHTDVDGNVTVHLNTPEFLGQLRIMAVAYSGPMVGSSDSPVLVRSPLVVQSSFPRFLAPNDSAEVSLLFINNSGVAGIAHTVLTSDTPNVLDFENPIPDVSLQPGEQKVITAKLIAKGAVGISHIALESKLGDDVYTEHLDIPVRPASPEISRGNYATATPDKAAALDIPAGLLPGTGSFELRITQRPPLGVLEGLQYLDHYPYGCCEQITSQCFPLVYLSDIGKQIDPGMFDEQILTRKIQSGITRLMGMQTANGGISMWPGANEEWPWGSVYVAHFLIEAEKAGQNVPEDFKARLLAYVRSILTKSAEPGPGTELQAYAAYVVALAGKPDRAVLSRLGEIVDAQDRLPTPPASLGSTRFHLALAWAATGRNDLAEKLLPQSLPLPRSSRELGGNLGSPVRDDALLLTTLLTVSPDHPAISQLVERLSGAGLKHQWYTTQENGLAIMALGKYLRATKDEKPFESADLMDGEKILATTAGGKPLLWTAPSDPPAHLTVRVKGDAGAKAHISWLQSGVPLQMPAAADHALKLRRTYLTEDDNPLAIDSLTSGTAVKVQIRVETASPLSNLVIEDLLPAGFEIENPRLSTALKQDPKDVQVQMNQQRLDVRDDRIIVVGSVSPGVSTFSYLVRAVTPGTYIVPPLRGECMYDPAINSLSGGGGHVTISSSEKKALASK